MSPNFIARLGSGLVAAGLLFAAAWAGSWWFGALAFPVIAVCAYEMFGMVIPKDSVTRMAGTLGSVGLMLVVTTGHARGEGGLAVMAAVVMGPALWFLFRTGEMETVAARIGLSTASLVWTGGLGALTTSLVLLEDGFAWLILAAVLAFGSDIGGYFVGKRFGRTKLYPKVSPNKTLEGSLGGVVFATGLAFGLRALFGPDMPVEMLAVIAPVGAVLGQVGDLAESMLKRSVGVKDSGRIMPGHGGLFDRIDALLFIGAVLFIYARTVVGVQVTWLSL